MATLSLLHAAKLTIRALSEVKDREDAYEFVKMACSRIKGISPVHLVHRERRLLIRGSLTCVQVCNDEQVVSFEPLADSQTPEQSDKSLGQRSRRADKLSKAVSAWRGRSNSVKSTASTVVSFSTAPSSFDVYVGRPALGTPVVRVESEPVDANVFVFTDLVLLASRLCLAGNEADACELEPLEGFGLSRVVSVLDEIGACVLFQGCAMCPPAHAHFHFQHANDHGKNDTPTQRHIRSSGMHHARPCPADSPSARGGVCPIHRRGRHSLALTAREDRRECAA